MVFFISLIHSFISYGIATVQRLSPPPLTHARGRLWMSVVCRGACGRGAGWRGGEPACCLQRPETEVAATHRRRWLRDFQGIKYGGSQLVVLVWSRHSDGLRSSRTISASQAGIGGNICCIVGRKLCCSLMWSLQAYNQWSLFFFIFV